MKKKDLMEFIDKVEHKAVRSVEERYDKLITDEKIKVLKNAGYAERINKLQKKINDLHAEAQALVLDMKDDVTVRYEHYCNAAYYLKECIGKSTIKDSVMYHAKYDGGSVELIKNKKSEEIVEVKANYNKVRVVCQGMLQASKIAEYLKGLGFDLSYLEKEESTALMCEIDKSKLFVCGENK